MSDFNPFRILIAPDKFKGTLTAQAAAQAMARGLRQAWPGIHTTTLALTDGGEGFVEVMTQQTGGKATLARTIDALGRPTRARWGVLGNEKTAVIGLSNASGLAQLPHDQRNPELTHNLGTGKLIALALEQGYKEILIGLGGSATTEGGISLAVAVGYRFLDASGADIPPTGAGLAQLAKIIPPTKKPKAKFIVATDVDNPLIGAKGAAKQFAPQKGADTAMVARLEANLRRLAKIVKRDLGLDFAQAPGAGAAGGCGFGLMAFFGAKRENGFELVRRATKLDAQIKAHDLVLTGEGCFDKTSLHGKAPIQLAALAQKAKRPIWAFCGRVDLPAKLSPFDLLAALSDPTHPIPTNLTPAEHAQRLQGLVRTVAAEAYSVE